MSVSGRRVRRRGLPPGRGAALIAPAGLALCSPDPGGARNDPTWPTPPHSRPGWPRRGESGRLADKQTGVLSV